MSGSKPSSDIGTFLKETEYQREQVAWEKEGNVPCNSSRSELKLSLTKITFYYFYCSIPPLPFLLLVSYLHKDLVSYIVLS